MKRALVAGCALLAVDVGYWIWLFGSTREEPPNLPGWQVALNIVSYWGGGLLFLVLLVLAFVELHRRRRS